MLGLYPYFICHKIHKETLETPPNTRHFCAQNCWYGELNEPQAKSVQVMTTKLYRSPPRDPLSGQNTDQIQLEDNHVSQ
jgi:hypothetical protein